MWQAGAEQAERLSILVVDDDAENSQLLAELLTAMGHDARPALSGLEALAAADERPPQVVFCDIGLPDVSGLEVVPTMRAQAREPLFAVAVTGYAEQSMREAAQRAGFDAFLVKPAGLEDIEEILRAAASHRRV
jgi:CheY-like chemotaxis protein